MTLSRGNVSSWGEMKLSNIVLKEREIYRRSHTKAQELNKQTGKEHLKAQTKQYILHAMLRQVNHGPRSPQAPPKCNSPDNCSSSKKPFPETTGLQEGKNNDVIEGKKRQWSVQSFTDHFVF